MAHHEPMDVDSDFDNKENSFHHSNVLPCTEKGYEELDVSELNMKLRYSVTPASSPMSKSYTANCVDNRNYESGDSLNIENANLTRSLNANLSKNDIVKSLKSLPLQSISSEQFAERNTVLRPLDTTVSTDDANITVTLTRPHDIDENLSLPSSSSSIVQTPEAITPTKEIPKSDGGSPIIRGLKSVFNMFRSSQSPIPPENEGTSKPEELSPQVASTLLENKPVVASTPIAANRKETSPSKRSSPHKESIIFNDDLEKELHWNDETTILFSQERIPIHKLFFQQPNDAKNVPKSKNDIINMDSDLNSTTEYMDISYNDSILTDKTLTDIQMDMNRTEGTVAGESDSEFVDCESTFTNQSQVIDNKDIIPVNQMQDLDMTKDVIKNENTSKLKPIILNTTQDILDATLSIMPEDLAHEVLDEKDLYVTLSEIEDNEKMFDKEIPEKPTESMDIKKLVINARELRTASEKQQQGDQTITIYPTNTELESANVTKTYEDYLLESNVLNNQTTALNNEDGEVKILDVAMPIPEDSNVTHTIENNVTQNCNVTKTIEDNICEAEILNNEASIPHSENFEVQSTKENEILNATMSVLENSNVTGSIDVVQNLNVTEIINDNDFEAKIFDKQPTTPCGVNESIEVQITNENETIPAIEKPNTTYIAETTHEAKTLKDQTLENKDKCQDFVPVIVNFDITPAHTNSVVIEAEVKESSHDSVQQTVVNDLAEVQNILEPEKHCANTITPIPTDNKVLEDLNNPVLENNNLITEHEFAIEQCELNITTDIFNLTKTVGMETQSNGNLGPGKEICMKIVPENDQYLYNKPVSGLPVDIPLPEDDMDKECNLEIPVEVQEKHAAPDLVDDLKNVTEIENNNTEANTTVICVSPTVASTNQNTVLMLTDNQNQFLAENVSVVEVPIEVVPEVVSLLSAENELTMDSLLEKKDIESESTNEGVQEVKLPDEIPNEAVLNISHIDINDSVIESKPLPDIINQTITSDPDNLAHSITTNIPEPTNVTKVPIGSENISPTTRNILNDEMGAELCEKFETSSNENLEKGATEMLPMPPLPTDVEPMVTVNDVVNMSINESILSCETVTSNLQEEYIKKSEIAEPDPSDPMVPENEIILTNVNSQIHINEEGINNKLDEEIIVSENNSPFVAVTAEIIPEENLSENKDCANSSLAAKTRILATPPASPPITSKGYNFNFDEIENPFATKTNIRLSPPPSTPDKSSESKPSENKIEKPVMSKRDINNRRKSQPERKRPMTQKKKLNSTFDSSPNVTVEKPVSAVQAQHMKPGSATIGPVNVAVESDTKANTSTTQDDITHSDEIHQLKTDSEIPKSRDSLPKSIECKFDDNKLPSDTTSEVKNSSSSEMSTYFSAGTSSSESLKSRNVFNIPEIDDKNFNPFATKSKMRQSPPPSLDMDNPFATRSKIKSSPDSSFVITREDVTENSNETKLLVSDDKMETEPMEKDTSSNISNTTNSSKATDDRNSTVREVNTEDEDTVEGPFLEAEDLHHDDKMSDFDGDNADMMQFNELPIQEKEENADTGELFIDAEAFEFLLNQNKSNTIADSGKESLFLKFDPLFAKRMSSDGVFAALSKLHKRQSTPTKVLKPPQKEVVSPIAGPSNLNITRDMHMNTSDELNDDLNVTVSKPMMVVPPAVNPIATPRNKSLTPTRSNRRSFNFTSPAMAVIDRLLSLSGNNTPAHDTTITQVTREQNEAELALTQLRELLAEKEIHVYNLRSESKELKDRLSTLETQVRSLEAGSQDKLKKINELNDKLTEKTKINKSMAAVVEEYERTIASLISETEQDKKRNAEERMKLINERDEQTAHLASMEVSFSDLHSKYEKSKQVILSCKANEDKYKKSIKDFEDNLTKMQNNYELLKQHATSKLNHANQELEKMNRAHEAEVLKLNAMIKRKELHITSLEETLTQKTKANEELTAICDELINKVG